LDQWHANCISTTNDSTVHTTFHAGTTMHTLIIRFIITLLCCLPTLAAAATTQSIHVEWGYTPPSEPAVSGFKLYQEGALACQVQNPEATSMDCQVTLTGATTNFTLTATFSDGTESPHSAPFTFATPSTSTTALQAVLSTDAVSGTTPLSVAFDASSSTGDIASYVWDFGDGSATATGAAATHVYATSGSYTAHLTVTGANGQTSATTTTITATAPAVTPQPEAPTPVITVAEVQAALTTNATSGTTPLSVSLDASSSTGEIASYLWDFGDGSATATGSAATHVYATSGSYTAHLTVTGANGLTSATTTTITVTSPPVAEVQAVLTTNAASGTAPLSVVFDASSSTGTIASYAWDFGDGATATGSTANHVYATSGSFTVQLLVTGTTGLTSKATTKITSTAPIVAALPAPPTAVISSSPTAAGPAPLTITFSGADSTAATTASITSYAWTFGDGATASSVSAAHTFTTAGTYTTTLVVTDNNGKTSTTNTPVVVTTPAVAANTAPTAVATTSSANGTAPLAVTFDGSASTDADGSISSYLWNFGDGSSATGKTASHTYLSDATFTATLQVTDNKGATGTTSVPITVKTEDLFAGLNIELGEIAVSSNWVRVPFNLTYQNPIVIAGPPGLNNADPCVVRLRNVNQTGFDIKLAEWNYEDGIHPEENITYLVMEKGRMLLPDGSSVEAGTFQGSTNSSTVKFSKAFAKAPVLMTTVASANEADAISGRIKNVGASSFAYYFREQERNRNIHAKETVNFIAWQPGKGTIGSVQYEVAATAKTVTNAWYAKPFAKAFAQPPLLLADMQTTNNTDTSALRVQNTTATGFQVKIEEEQSLDKEVTHPAEVVGYLVFDKVEE
jgi:PKD repeat protein